MTCSLRGQRLESLIIISFCAFVTHKQAILVILIIYFHSADILFPRYLIFNVVMMLTPTLIEESETAIPLVMRNQYILFISAGWVLNVRGGVLPSVFYRRVTRSVQEIVFLSPIILNDRCPIGAPLGARLHSLDLNPWIPRRHRSTLSVLCRSTTYTTGDWWCRSYVASLHFHCCFITSYVHY